MTYNWYDFWLTEDGVEKIKWRSHAPKDEVIQIDQGTPGETNLVCAKDELHAFMLINKWLRLGKPLNKTSYAPACKGVWICPDGL